MSAPVALLGLYQPGESLWHRLGVGWKYLAVLLLSVPALLLQQPWVTLVWLLLTAVALMFSGLPWRLLFGLPRGLILLLAVLVAFQLFLGQPESAVVVPGNTLLAVLAARLILLTTRASDLVDALISGFGRIPGVDGERFGLAVGLMLRSVPFLVGAFTEVGDAARARGLERNWLARLTPVVVRAVGFAHATGEALAARGLGERAPRGSAPGD